MLIADWAASAAWCGDGWWDLRRWWSEIADISREWKATGRSSAKWENAGRSGARVWKKEESTFVGLMGELVVALETGLPLTTALISEGDSGWDFVYLGRTVDIKTATYDPPHLKEYLDPGPRADCFVLSHVDYWRQRARVVGHATRFQVATAPVVDYGHGPRLSLGPERLTKGIPPWLPRRSV